MPGSDRGEGTATLGNAFALAIAFALCCIIVGTIAYQQGLESERRYQSPHSHAEDAETDAKRACAGIDPSAVFECVYKKVEASEETARAEQDLSAQQLAATSALIAAIISLITLVISGVGVWFVKRTLDETIKAVRDTGEATKAMKEANAFARLQWTTSFKPDLFGEITGPGIIPLGYLHPDKEGGMVEIRGRVVITNRSERRATLTSFEIIMNGPAVHPAYSPQPMFVPLGKDEQFIPFPMRMDPEGWFIAEFLRPKTIEESMSIRDLPIFCRAKYVDELGQQGVFGFCFHNKLGSSGFERWGDERYNFNRIIG